MSAPLAPPNLSFKTNASIPTPADITTAVSQCHAVEQATRDDTYREQVFVHLRVQCSTCGKYYHKSSLPHQMRRIHRGIKKHRCDVCKKMLVSKQERSQHALTHQEGPNFLCQVCNKALKTARALKVHLAGLHRIDSKETLTCTYCGKSYATAKRCWLHIAAKQPVKATRAAPFPVCPEGANPKPVGSTATDNTINAKNAPTGRPCGTTNFSIRSILAIAIIFFFALVCLAGWWSAPNGMPNKLLPQNF